MGETIGRPMEILLVEDSLTSARLTIGALRQSGIPHRMTWLSDGQEALDFLHHRGRFTRAPRPDLILLDLALPGRTGLDVLAEIRADEELASLPVVVLTASTSAEDMAQAQSQDVQSYLTKPVDVTRFLEVVRELRRYWRAELILPPQSS